MSQDLEATRNESETEIRLGIWGPPNAGKTVYMTMLYQYLTDHGSDKWRVVPDSGTNKEFLKENIRSIEVDGEFVDPTEKRSPSLVYSYTLISRDSLRKNIKLKFFDLSGEFYLDAEESKIKAEGNELSIPQYLNLCDGILFLISPLKEDIPIMKDSTGRMRSVSYYELLRNLFTSMQNSRHSSTTLSKLEQFAVFGITKVDHPEVYEEFSSQSPEESILKILGGKVSLNWFANFFNMKIRRQDLRLHNQPSAENRCQFFYISPFGVYKNKQNQWQSPIYEKKNRNEDRKNELLEKKDPIFQDADQRSGEIDEYSSIPGISSGDIKKQALKEYLIDIKAPRSPINVITPILWLIEGIERHRSKLSFPDATIVEKEN